MSEPVSQPPSGAASGSASASYVLDGASDPAAFRAAMRRVISGVTVVTTRHDGRPWGMTVNAFSSVCVEPPTVLVCVNNRTVTASDIALDGHFAANLLSEDQLYLSRLCAQPGQPKYLDDFVVAPDEMPMHVATPVLRDSLVTFDCTVGEARPVGSHFVVIGTVDTILTPPARKPLLYGEGRYCRGVEIHEAPAMTGLMGWL